MKEDASFDAYAFPDDDEVPQKPAVSTTRFSRPPVTHSYNSMPALTGSDSGLLQASQASSSSLIHTSSSSFTDLTNDASADEATSDAEPMWLEVQYGTYKRSITFSNLLCLQSGQKFNTDVIDMYIAHQIEMFNERSKKMGRAGLKADYVDSYVAQKGYQLSTVKEQMSQLRRKKGKSFLDFDFVFVTVNVDGHWCVAVICMQAKQKPIIILLDSLYCDDNESKVTQFIRNMIDTVRTTRMHACVYILN